MDRNSNISCKLYNSSSSKSDGEIMWLKGFRVLTERSRFRC